MTRKKKITITGLKMKSKQVEEVQSLGHFCSFYRQQSDMSALCMEHEIRINFYQHHPYIIREHDRCVLQIITYKLQCVQCGNLVNTLKHISLSYNDTPDVFVYFCCNLLIKANHNCKISLSRCILGQQLRRRLKELEQ